MTGEYRHPRDVLFIGGVADGQRMSIKGGIFVDVPVYGGNFAIQRYTIAPIASPASVRPAWIAYLPEDEARALELLQRGYSANAMARTFAEAWPALEEAIRRSGNAQTTASEWQARDALLMQLRRLYAEVRKYVA